MATCRQLPYLYKPATSNRCDVILIMTSFATELVMPSITDVRTDALPRLIRKDRATF